MIDAGSGTLDPTFNIIDGNSTTGNIIDGNPAIIPVENLTTTDILYGSRTTTVRFEVLTHNATTGLDSLQGTLDGVKLDGSLAWSSSGSVKKSGTINVVDLTSAQAGLLRVADIDLVAARIRPVLVISGLPEIPLGVYVITAAPETWTATGRSYAIELHDRCTVLDQDAFGESYTVAAGTVVLSAVSTVVGLAGEQITVDGSDVRTAAKDMVWAAGTTKLQVVNDLLSAINYNALWVDGVGAFRATPYILPAKRSILYTVLNDASGSPLTRQLVDGAQSIYEPDWSRVKDSFGVPNKVVAVQAATGTAAALTGSWSNTDASSPYSVSSRGRSIVAVLPGVQTPTDTDPNTVTFLNATAQRSLIARSAVQASVSLKCLPIPVELLDAVQFASTPAGINTVHTVQAVTIPLTFDGVMSLTLQEIIDL